MSGIILLIVLSIWIFLANVFAKFFLSRMKLDVGKKKIFARIGLFVLVFIAPVADDIIGGFQFRAMCTPENMLVYDPEKVRGRSVVYRDVPLQTIYKIIPIVVTTGQWEDLETRQVLITLKKYDAKGGWLSRLIGFPEGSPPYTFKGSCNAFKAYNQLIKQSNITVIEN